MAKEKICGIYKIENLVNGKVYIGSSIDIYRRWENHKSTLRGNRHHSFMLQRAWNKYKEKDFKFEIIKIFNGNIKELRLLEQHYMDLYKSYDFNYGYNVSKNSFYGTHSPTTYKDIEDGKFEISKDQFDAIIYYLCNTNISIPKISKLTGVYYRSIYQIYYKENYTNIVKDLNFIQRKNSGEENHNTKLTKNKVKDIIIMLLNNEYIIDIARKFNVKQTIICDIHLHKSWKDLTKDIVFPEYEKAYGRNGKPVSQYDLEGNFIATYESAREAEKETGIGYKMISRVCKGKRPHTHGFIWNFAS